MEVPAIQIQSDNGLAMKYGDSIDLSNACRAFYQARLESTRRLKEKWKDTGEMDSCGEPGTGFCNGNIILRRGSNSSGSSSRRGSDSDSCGGTSSPGGKTDGRKKTSLDIAIDVLRREMAALMDQDLCLMKQLLTLNEEIEDLKWRRRYGWSRASSFCSSDNMIQSAASLGKVDEHPNLEFLTPSSLSLQLDASTTRLSFYNDEDPVGTFNRACTATTTTANGKFDSKDSNDAERLCPGQNNSNSECSKTSCCTTNRQCKDKDSNLTNCEVSPEQTFESSSETGASSVECHAVENGQVYNEKAYGRSAANHTGENPSSTTNTSYSREFCDKDSSALAFPGTTDKLINDRRPKPSSCRNKRTKKLVDADVESQDSGIHDCFGTV